MLRIESSSWRRSIGFPKAASAPSIRAILGKSINGNLAQPPVMIMIGVLGVTSFLIRINSKPSRSGMMMSETIKSMLRVVNIFSA